MILPAGESLVNPPRIRGVPAAQYAGHCRRCGREHLLHNDVALALQTLDALFTRLHDTANDEVRAALDASRGKMVGVLVGQGGQVLTSFSGDLGGRAEWPGWVPPVEKRELTAQLEAETLARIAAIELELGACDVEGARQRLAEVEAAVREEAVARRRQQAEEREARRDQVDAWEWERQKRSAWREGKPAREAARARVESARDAVRAVEEKVRTLRESRRNASATLMAAMFDVVVMTSARGERRPLREVFVGAGMPSGTGQCAVPKLLHAANLAGIRPVAIAEAWWGPTVNGRTHGEVQAPCERKCQPILGYLLCGADGP
ncbi:MAG: hypothetical protein AB2A00_32260 [Myxococcota bacterium]